MRNPASCFGEHRDFRIVDVNRVGEPDIIAYPAKLLHQTRRTQFVLLEGKLLFVGGFSQVRVQTDLVLPRHLGGFDHKVVGDREWRAGRQYDSGHRPVIRIMVGFNDALAVLEDGRFFFDAAIGRQATLGLALGHTAARGMKTHTHTGCGMDGIINRATVGKYVLVIKSGGAARERQFGQTDLNGQLDVIRPHPRPHRIKYFQPVPDIAVLRGRDDTRKVLVQVMVSVDQTR